MNQNHQTQRQNDWRQNLPHVEGENSPRDKDPLDLYGSDGAAAATLFPLCPRASLSTVYSLLSLVGNGERKGSDGKLKLVGDDGV